MPKDTIAMPGFDAVPTTSQAPVKRKEDSWIDDLVGALCDPLIVFPAGGWEDDIKAFPLYKELAQHRLIHLMLCQQGKADINECSDLEAMLYMYPRTMQAPLGEQWTRIYLYLGTQVMKEMPEDIKQKELSQYDMRELRHLKRWIRERVLKARKERRRQEKQEKTEKPAVEPVECEQIRLF